MSEPKNFSVANLLLSWSAMLLGMGLLLFELTTSLLHRNVPTVILWLVYLVLLLASVWGMKSLLEFPTGAMLKKSLEKVGLGNLRKRKTAYSHNLFRLPAEGQMYVLMLTIMLLGALFGKTNTLMLIFALMAGPFIVNGGITFGMTRRLHMQRHLPERVMVGEPTSVDITIQNRKRFISSSLVAVEDRITGPRELLYGKLMFAQIPARSTRTGRYQIKFMQRGKYVLGPTRITSRFPLGIVERGRQVEDYDAVLVYPRIGFLAAWWQRRLTDGQEVSRTAHGQAGAHQDEFHRIREYRQGDELRSIHWKTSARRNELMVREYRQNRDRRLLLILDLWQPRPSALSKMNPAEAENHTELIENAVSLAATIGWGHLQECGPQQLDFICFGDERRQWLGSASRGDQTQNLLDEFALAEPGSRFKTSQIEEEVLARQSGTTRCVIITTRKRLDFHTSAVGAPLETSSWTQGVLIVEADPAQTAEFFQQVG